MTKQNILLTPGPTPVPPDVLEVMAEPIFHHRTPQYRKLFREVSEGLKLVFRTRYPVYTFTGSGTLAMEASMVNFLSSGDKVIVLEAGKFGERWSEIAKAYQIKTVSLKAPYGDAIAPGEVEKALKLHPDAKGVYGTLCETSTGVLLDIESIAKLVAQTNAIFVVDAISGLAADPLEMDGWKVDVVVSGSQKGLMIPPGLAFISYSDKAKRLFAKATLQCFYVNLSKYEKSLQDSDTPFTPALTLVLALQAALQKIRGEGLEQVWHRTKTLAGETRALMTELGLQLFAKRPANTLTAVHVPQGIDGEKLVSTMRDEKGVTLAGGQGEMKGKIFRIAHLGFITASDIRTGVKVLQETLAEMGHQSKSKARA